MDLLTLCSSLEGQPLAEIRFFEVIGSTNQYALEWAEQGAPDQCLVVAEEQTQGRGRMGRSWSTPAGCALAFSLILRPTPEEAKKLPLFSLWSALSLSRALKGIYGIQAQVKWPNDVLLKRKKTAGILAEAVWLGDQVSALVIGMGVNVSRNALPPQDRLLFPATCIEEHTHTPVNRMELLSVILKELISIRSASDNLLLLEEYTSMLAFLGEKVCIMRPEASTVLEGTLVGINSQGDVCIKTRDGTEHAIQAGDVHLRAIPDHLPGSNPNEDVSTSNLAGFNPWENDHV